MKSWRISLKFVAIFMLGIAVVMTGIIIWNIQTEAVSYQRLNEATDAYIDCQQDCFDMKAASDYLTFNARSFVMNGDVEHLNNFFYEVNVNQRRDKALKSLESLLPADTESILYLKNALQTSNDLIQIELHAMRLSAASFHLDEALLPEELKAYVLTEDELSLLEEEQKDKAVDLLFGH